MVAGQLWDIVWYFLNLSLNSEAAWEVAPLAFATLLIIAYFQLYKSEKAGWNTYLSNSLVLLFVSLSLTKYVYGISGEGFANFIDYPYKSIAILGLVVIGVSLTRFNFEHLIPEKYAKYLSSPITVDLMAYAAILFVHSKLQESLIVISAILIIILLLTLLLTLLKFPIRRISKIAEKEKRRERVKNIKEALFEIEELQRELKERNQELKKHKVRELEQQKKEAIKLKKMIKKR